MLIKATTLIILFFSASLLTGCNTLQSRFEYADAIASKHNFEKHIIEAKDFNLVSFQKITSHSDSVVIYIEGDGQAWKNKYQVSPNPTPQNPIGFKLASLDPSANVIYIARPCQFINIKKEKNCYPENWTNKRTSSQVIDSFNVAIDLIKNELDITKIRLVGFSGGATITTILSAIRDDVLDLRTVAGNLDIDKFVEVHQVTPLTGSMNPINYAKELISIPQKHLISENDKIITEEITESYLNQLKLFDKDLRCVNVINLSKPEHTKGWATYWQAQTFDKIETCKS